MNTGQMTLEKIFEYFGVDIKDAISRRVAEHIEAVVDREVEQSAALRAIIRQSMMEYINSKGFMKGVLKKVGRAANKEASVITKQKRKK